MFRFIRMFALPAVAIAIPLIAWKYMRHNNDPFQPDWMHGLDSQHTWDDRTQALGIGSWGSRMRLRVRQLLAGDWNFIAYDADDHLGPIRFEWVFGATEAGVVGAALAAEGVAVETIGDAPEHRDIIVTDKLESAGIHLDQEPRDDFSSTPVSRYTGSATPRRLMNAIERTLDTTHSGLIVDTTMSPVVEIDEHREVGKGNVVLLRPSGSHVLRHGTVRLLLQALRDVATGESHPGFARETGEVGHSFGDWERTRPSHAS